jgi:hypothetical protein
MNLLYNLKDWFSLPDAAKRISLGIDEQVSQDDLIQLILEGHLPLSWYIRHHRAKRVAPFTSLFGEGFPPYLDEIYSCKAVGNRGLRSVEWQHYPIDDYDVIHHLDGPYRLELELCEALKDWVHSMLTNTHGKLITIMGFYVSDQENTIWQIMEYSPRESRCYASVKFPSLSELIIQREDIEAFESQLAATGKRRTDVQVTEQKRTKQSDGAYLMEKYLDETPEGGLSGFVRFMKQAAGAGVIAGERLKWTDPLGKTHAPALSSLANQLTHAKEKRRGQ